MNDELAKSINERLRDAIRNYIGYGAVALVALSYVASSFLTIEATGKSVYEIIADGAIAFLLGITVNRMFDVQGLRNGERDGRVLAAEERHAALVEAASPYLDALDAFCEEKNTEALSRARRTYLSCHGLRYTDYFDAEGICIRRCREHGRGLRARFAEFREARRVRHAERLRLTRLSAGLLISDAGNPQDPYELGRSKREYERESGRSDLFTKLLTAILFGYYGVSLLQGFSPADLIWTILQVGLFLLMGGIKMERSYLYVTDEYRARITKKSDILRMFDAWRGEKNAPAAKEGERYD